MEKRLKGLFARLDELEKLGKKIKKKDRELVQKGKYELTLGDEDIERYAKLYSEFIKDYMPKKNNEEEFMRFVRNIKPAFEEWYWTTGYYL